MWMMLFEAVARAEEEAGSGPPRVEVAACLGAELADDLLKDFAILAGLGDGIGIENDAAGLNLGAVAAHAVLAHHGGSGLLIVLRGGLGLGSNGPDSEEDRRGCEEE